MGKAAIALLALATPAGAATVKNNAPLNQQELQVLGRKVNDRGADESLRNSTVYAMQALMDLNATKLTSAMTNGYKAYGKFRNSENLDRLKDLNAVNANSLASIGSGPVLLPSRTITSFRRVDPSFLQQGEAAKVAAEFERQTGMARADFLTQMADVSEKKIKRSDPQMIDKAFSRFEGFLSKIPNQEFRNNVQKNMNLVPDTVRRGMVGQAVAKLAGFFADAGGSGPAPSGLDSSITDAKLASAGSSAPASVAAAAGGAGSDSKKDARHPSSAGNGSGNKAADKGPPRKGELGNVVLTALLTQNQDSVSGASEVKPIAEQEPEPLVLAATEASEELTIFQQVTKRYRLLTPLISKLP